MCPLLLQNLVPCFENGVELDQLMGCTFLIHTTHINVTPQDGYKFI